ncbi:hypothetical protein RD792_008602 [Penstemon davidsonii]|uniref:SOSEKI DIX-like domain-containing protein n=1 Tax=Penstemon davidsonii TaxID=160366 RepID=A0ABR0DAD8_9LAMI|nr:hypothetical protein RD792_008602 [Penstemon davidsonii]
MEGVHVQARKINRELSPEKGKISVNNAAARVVMKPTFKKVQVVYYLSRNGHLEHPHYIEVVHLAHQPLRLKDVMDRLTVLRGKGMPSLYSWSCKRSYKNGYVWNDLGENDAIYPSEGPEYVLKGSELNEGCSEKLLHLQVNNIPHGNNQPMYKPLTQKHRPEPEQMMRNHQNEEKTEYAEEEEEEEEETEEYEEIRIPCSRRRSRGVSTDEYKIEEFKQQETQKNNIPTEITADSNSFSSPPSTTSSTTLSDKANNDNGPDLVGSEPMLSRNSMLFSLIACGGSASFRKSVPPPPCTAARKSESGGNLRKGVVCKAAAKVVVEEDEDMIGCMSENPRFGNLQAEEKEYFSGSIVDSMSTEEKLRLNIQSGLKKSNSYNEER